MITSKDNAKIKSIASLVSSAKRRREAGVFVLEGTRLCSEALAENVEVLELYYTKQAECSVVSLINDLKQKARFESEVSSEVFKKISDTTSPQGVLALVSLKCKVEAKFSGKWIGFERVADPSNLGAAARTAEALGFDGILISNSSACPYSPKSLRASMGALLRIPIVVVDDFLGTVSAFKQKGFTVSGTVVQSSALKINEISFNENEIVLIGNEANGLTNEAKEICDRLVTIPMLGRAESLNAAVAATIVMWEMVR